ncbi:MAG: mechanosensitive ion channel domain-containing protein, partial [Pseudomonadota bacterium]
AVRLVFVALGLVLALDILGATALIGTVLGAAGLVGLAVGFAVRDTVENYIASILLSLRQPFRPNDLVLIEGIEGHVTAMTSRATVLTTLESNHVRIPNATVFKAVITNYSREPVRRFDFRVGVETDDLRRAVDLGLESIRALDFVLDDPDPIGFIEGVGDSAIVLFFAGWIDQRTTSWPKAKSEAIRVVMLAFEAADIGVPEPIYRLRFDGAGAEVRVIDGEGRRKPAAKPRPAPIDETPADVGLDIEADLQARVAEERTHTHDLLDDNAPRETDG